MKEKTMTKKQRIGYSLGIFADSLVYNMFYTYYLAFLIEIAGIKPAYSSIIIFISIAWDAITDPIIGYMSDKPGVDKRKLMKFSLIPLGLVFVLGWTAIGSGFSSQFIKILIYTVISMMIWLFYTLYTIPYYSVLPEITSDYDERTSIRSTSSLLNAFAVGIGNILPALVPTVAILLGKKYESNSYAVIAAVISVLSIIMGLVCVRSLKDVYRPTDKKIMKSENGSIKDIFKTFADILKMKSALIILLFVFLYLVASSMIQSNITYLVIDCIGFEYDTGIAIFIISLVIGMAITVPFVEKLSAKKDRKFAMIVFVSAVTVLLFIIKIIGLDFKIGNFGIMIFIMPFILGVAQGTFWTLFYPICYDLVELDELKNKKRREGTVTALPQFVQKFGSAFGILMAGQLLSFYGYASNDIAGKENLIERVTDPKIVNGMENISTLIPAVILAVSVVVISFYPITRKRYNEIIDKIKNNKK